MVSNQFRHENTVFFANAYEMLKSLIIFCLYFLLRTHIIPSQINNLMVFHLFSYVHDSKSPTILTDDARY